jgi:hypothetical protein
MRLKLLLSGSLVLMLLFAGCKKDPVTTDLQFGYYPLQQGRFVTYFVKEVTIDDDLQQNDTAYYYIKTVVGDTITDNEGRVARRYNRYFRDSLTQPWTLRDIWTAIVDGPRAELVEENQRTIKLVFAPTKFKEWNCNAYNTLGTLDCYYRDIHVPGSINGFQFDSTITVEQEDTWTFVDYRRKFEQYAKGVGMYYKHYKDFRINFGDSTNVVKGRELIMQLVDYGVE